MKYAWLALVFLAPMAQAETVAPRYSVRCVLWALATKRGISLNPAVSQPSLYLESTTPLQQFQDAVEPQWGMRPERFLNVYVMRTNEIYLIDDGEYYRRRGRFIEDSLAHELTHYLQVAYEGADPNHPDDALENDAVAMQTWFRETFLKDGSSPCGELVR